MQKNETNLPVRILHVVTRMDAAGIETFLMNIYRNIDRKKIQFDFLTHRSDEGFYDEEIKKLGGKIYHVPSINPFHHQKYIEALDSFFTEHKEYKIVHSHINTFSMYVLRSAKKNGVPVRIAHSHISSVPVDYKFFFREYCRSRINEFPTEFFACSDAAGKWLFKNKEFKVINNGIDVSSFTFNKEVRKSKRKELGLEECYVVGNIGRFTSQKNQLFLLDILKQLVMKKEDVVLLLIGTGKLKDEIKKKAKMLDIQSHVIILENRKDVNELLMAMDVFVFPSRYEGLGIVAIESQSSGLPTVISKNLPKELQVSDYIIEEDLSASPDKWSETILSFKNHNREDIDLTKLKKNFEIKKIATNLQEYYLGINII